MEQNTTIKEVDRQESVLAQSGTSLEASAEQPRAPVAEPANNRLKIPIVVISVVALVAECFLVYFYIKSTTDLIDIGIKWEATDSFLMLLELFSNFVPFVLLIGYVLRLYRHAKAVFVVPLIFGLKLLTNVLGRILTILMFPEEMSHMSPVTIVWWVVIALQLACMFVGALMGFRVKWLVIAPAAFLILNTTLASLKGIIGNPAEATLSLLVSICFYIAAILFASKNRIVIFQPKQVG